MSEAINLRLYQAMDAKDRNTVDGLELRLSDGRIFVVQRLEKGPMALSPDQTVMTLLFRSGSVIFYGIGLAELLRAVNRWRIEWVQAFDAVRFDRPTDPRALFVERIDVYMRSEADDEALTPDAAQADSQQAKH